MAFTIVYDWEDSDAALRTTGGINISKAEQKFGDHYSDAATLEAAFIDTAKYIRNSLGRQKHKFDQNRVVIHKMWDATLYAKSKNRFGKHQKIDDIIRPVIGNHIYADVHEIDHETLIKRVNRELAKQGQPLPTVGLAAWQSRAAESVLAAVAVGKRTIAAEYAARFGKTIWGGAVAIEMQVPLTIITSYVLTSFTSFEKDLTSYEQFKDLVLVDTSLDDYQTVINSALANNQQVVAFLSMCMGDKRQKKINYLFGLNVPRLVLIDEADFGVHKSGQTKPLINARRPGDVVILMTGTNADKAASTWQVDHIMSVVYPELVMEKKLPQISYPTSLKKFAVDPKRHELVVDVEFYQMALQSLLDQLRQVEPEAFFNEGVYLASWSKTAANPIKAKGFWSRMLQAVFLGEHGLDDLNIEYQIGTISKQRIAMMFLPGSTTNDNLGILAALAKQAIPGYHIIPIYGEEMTNRTAEHNVKEQIEHATNLGQSVLLLSAGMAQRSFSVGEITELYLAYDEGDNGATIQKMSRALTPYNIGKIGRIISLSFDPNRDDKFDGVILETALNYKKSHNLSSAKDAMRDVIRTIDIFRCSVDGRVKLEVDEYLNSAIARNSVSRVIGKVSDLTNATPEMLHAIASGKSDVFRAAIVAAAEKGKTRLIPQRKASGITDTTDEKITAALLARAREVIITIIENLDIIVSGTGVTQLFEAFKIIRKNATMRDAISVEFGVEFDFIVALFEDGIIDQNFIELLVDV